jgi:GcrA cell cycle regulator
MSSRKNMKFWEQHDAELRQYAEVDGLTSKEVAEKLGVSRDAVTGRASRIGVRWHNKPLFWKMKQEKKLQKVLAERKAAEEMAERSAKDLWANRTWSFPPYGHCVFPRGDLRKPDFSFCGEPVIRDGKPYCPTHHSLAYSRGV